MTLPMKISVYGTGNAGFRLAISLKTIGFDIPYVVNRTYDSAKQLASILNKPEYNMLNLPDTISSTEVEIMEGSDLILICVSDDAIQNVLDGLFKIPSVINGYTTVCHISGGTSIDVLSLFPSYGVFYPLMTLSKNKPIDIKLVPFLLEYSDLNSGDKLKLMCGKMGSEFSEADSVERLRMHIAAVFISNFVNYLSSLSYDISAQNHVYLLPLAIETIRKAFLYGNPANVQTGPASRGDLITINKHLEILKSNPEHYRVYELLSNYIINQSTQLKRK